MVRRIVERDGKALKLTPKEYDLLVLLARHAGRVVTHKTLLTSVWGPAHGEDMHYLRVFIGQLRGKIERDCRRSEDHPDGAGRRLPVHGGLMADETTNIGF